MARLHVGTVIAVRIASSCDFFLIVTVDGVFDGWPSIESRQSLSCVRHRHRSINRNNIPNVVSAELDVRLDDSR